MNKLSLLCLLFLGTAVLTSIYTVNAESADEWYSTGIDFLNLYNLTSRHISA